MKKLWMLLLLTAVLMVLGGCGEKEKTVAGTCTFSISCQTLADAPEKCVKEKRELIPADGWVLPAETVEFYEGESVFDVLLREARAHKIHMEYSETPLYQAAYIEGIANLYEFDAGETSGWVYSVNGWFPNYGCSKYRLSDGDVVCWSYTCDLGRDVGAEIAEGQE